jgi:hypothetical protein
MKIQGVAQTENYIKQNLKNKKKWKILVLFLFFKKNFSLFDLFLYNFKNFYNFMKDIFVIVGHINIVSSLGEHE